jgi:hypothetical protein
MGYSGGQGFGMGFLRRFSGGGGNDDFGSDTISAGPSEGGDIDDFDVYSMSNRNRYCRPKILAGTALALGVACVIIGVSVSASRSSGDDVSPTPVSAEYNPAHTEPVKNKSILLPPPFDLVEICSSTSLQTEDGLAECEMACGQASCCRPDSGIHNCFTDNSDLCLDYTPCYSVLNEDFGPAPGSTAASDSSGVSLDQNKFASETLAETCNASDLAECSELCERGRCCFEPFVECHFDEDEQCEKFEPCAVLDEFDDVWNLVNLGAGAILQNDEGGISLVETSLDRSKLVPSNLDEICNERDLSECMESCDKGRCCFEAVTQCAFDKNDVCDGFRPCAVLDIFDDEWDLATLGASNGGGTAGPNDVRSPPAVGGMMGAPVADSCREEFIAKRGTQTCEEMCYAFECCFVEGPDNCIDSNDCEGMGAPCAIIYGEGGEEPPKPFRGGR